MCRTGASLEAVDYATNAYLQQRRSVQSSLLLGGMCELRAREGLVVMAYTMEDFKRDSIKEHLSDLTPQEQEEVLRALPAAWRLFDNLPPQVKLAGLPPEEQLAGLLPEMRLIGLSLEQLERMREYLDRAITTLRTRSRQPRRKK